MVTKKKNCATIFLLPGIGLVRKDVLEVGFISAYLDDVNHEPHYENAVYLLFKPENMDTFRTFMTIEKLRSAPILEDYDYEGGYVVVVYRFFDKYMPEYQLFLEGKYSKFSEEYIKLFPEQVAIPNADGKIKMEYSLQYHIFNRSNAIKEFWEDRIGQKLDEDAELWSSPDLDLEVLDINNL